MALGEPPDYKMPMDGKKNEVGIQLRGGPNNLVTVI